MKRGFFIFIAFIVFSTWVQAETLCERQSTPLFIFSSIDNQVWVARSCFDSDSVEGKKLKEDLNIADDSLWGVFVSWVQGIYSQWLPGLNRSHAIQVNYGLDTIAWIKYSQGYVSAIDSKTQNPLFSMMVKEESLAQGDFNLIQETASDCNVNPAFSVWAHERIFLYGTLNDSSSNYYAWDVTDINIKENQFHPVMKFSILGGRSAPEGSPYAEMGMLQSAPSLGQVRISGEVHPVLFFGGGYDPVYGNETVERPSFSPPAKGSQLYMVDANTGVLLWWASHYDSGATHIEENMIHSIVSSVKVIDSNHDGLTDLLYFGDLGGQVFQMNINNNSVGSFAEIARIARADSASSLFDSASAFSSVSADNRLSVFAQCANDHAFSPLYLVNLLTKEVKSWVYHSGGKIKIPLNSALIAPGRQVVFSGRYTDFNSSSAQVSAGALGDLANAVIKTTYWRRVGS